jgi:hypothetical protein
MLINIEPNKYVWKQRCKYCHKWFLNDFEGRECCFECSERKDQPQNLVFSQKRRPFF